MHEVADSRKGEAETRFQSWLSVALHQTKGHSPLSVMDESIFAYTLESHTTFHANWHKNER